MKGVFLSAIAAYQRYLSPHKGFRCAFHAHTGRGSCSGYGHRVIARFGAMRGLRLLRRRLADCRVVATQNRELSRLPNSPQRTTRDRLREGGFCDGCLEGCFGYVLEVGASIFGAGLSKLGAIFGAGLSKLGAKFPESWRRRWVTWGLWWDKWGLFVVWGIIGAIVVSIVVGFLWETGFFSALFKGQLWIEVR